MKAYRAPGLGLQWATEIYPRVDEAPMTTRRPLNARRTTTNHAGAVPGTPVPGSPVPGSPDHGLLDHGPPDPGPPDPGTSDPGTPDPGPPDPGIPNPGTPAQPPSDLAPERRIGRSFAAVLRCFFGIGLLLTGIGHATGQVSEANRDRLLAEIDAARERFRSDDLPNLEAARAGSLGSIDRVRQWLASASDADNAAAWLRYLNLNPLADALGADAAPAELIAEATSLRERLVGTWPGLETPRLRGLRSELDRLLAAARFGNPDDAADLYLRQLDVLADRTGRLSEVPTANEIATLSRILEVLQDTGQTDRLLLSYRDRFSHPNLIAQVSATTVQEAVTRTVDEVEPVRDCILGTRLIGRGQLWGKVTAELIPSTTSAMLAIRLDARFNSQNTGYNGPVRLRTVSNGRVTATRTIRLNELGLSAEPVVTEATLATHITAIEHPRKLVRKIARKRAAKQKPLADRITLRKLRDRIGERFAEQTGDVGPPPALADAQAWLARLDIPVPSEQWSSTADALTLRSALSRTGQLDSPVPPPTIAEGNAAAFQIHESAVDNSLTRFLAGRTIRQSQISRLLESLRVAPRRREANEDEPPFVIDFARLRPIIFEARDDSIRLGIRGTRFEQGGRELRRPLEITAVYRAAETDDQMTSLTRDDEIRVDFPGDARLTFAQTALRSTIKRLFDELFPRQILDAPLVVAENSPLEALRGREFRPHRVTTDDGWLTVTLR